MGDADVVRAAFAAYRDGDVDAAGPLYADGMTFTSPQDDHIGRDAFFARCFPTADRFVEQRMMYVVGLGGGDVFVMYEYELPTGAVHRNTEVLTVRDGQITEVQVFFGGNVRTPGS